MDWIKEWWGLLITGGGALLAALYAQTMGRITKTESNVGKIFDEMKAHERRDEDRFAEMTTTMHTNHVELLEAINGRRRRD